MEWSEWGSRKKILLGANRVFLPDSWLRVRWPLNIDEHIHRPWWFFFFFFFSFIFRMLVFPLGLKRKVNYPPWGMHLAENTAESFSSLSHGGSSNQQKCAMFRADLRLVYPLQLEYGVCERECDCLSWFSNPDRCKTSYNRNAKLFFFAACVFSLLGELSSATQEAREQGRRPWRREENRFFPLDFLLE